MKAWGYTDVGKVRSNNEDAYFIKVDSENNFGFCVVCDGMGGAAAGNLASKIAVNAFSKVLSNELKPAMTPKQTENIISKAVKSANKSVHDKAAEDKSLHGMGTTLVATVFSENSVIIVNVGDSRAYQINREGIALITRDHSLVEDMLRLGEITKEQANKHPGKNLITRAVGTDEKVHEDIYRLDKTGVSFILLCTDGLTNLVTEQEILYEIMYGKNHSECCRRLADIANTRGGYDNITSVLIAF